MATAPVHLPARAGFVWLERTQFWGSVSIVIMWLAVLFVGVWGSDIVGSDGARVPSVIVVALFACIATVSVARRAFVRDSS
jgi:hypothetical protein